MRQCGVAREEIWITSKIGFFPTESDQVWMFNANNVKGQESTSIDICLQQLGVSSIDLLLIHNPCTSATEYNSATLPHFFEYFNYSGSSKFAIKPKTLATGEDMRELMLNVHRQRCILSINKDEAFEKRKASWLAMEKAVKDGKCRYIGVSNYPADLLLEMKSYATILPVVNEIEFHPTFASPSLLEVCRSMNILVIGYGIGVSMLIEHPNSILLEMADKLGIKPMQVLLKFAIQKGVIPIPRSGDEEHLKDNVEAADMSVVSLSPADIAALDGLNREYPYYWDHVSSALTCQARNENENI